MRISVLFDSAIGEWRVYYCSFSGGERRMRVIQEPMKVVVGLRRKVR